MRFFIVPMFFSRLKREFVFFFFAFNGITLKIKNTPYITLLCVLKLFEILKKEKKDSNSLFTFFYRYGGSELSQRYNTA